MKGGQTREHKSRRPVDWEAFVLRYETKLYRTALAILGDAQEAEDAVPDTFLRYLEKAPVFPCPAQEAAWMTRVTVNRCISLLRSPWRRRVEPLPPELPAREAEARELEELYRHLETAHHFRIDPRRTVLTGRCQQCMEEEDAHGTP